MQIAISVLVFAGVFLPIWAIFRYQVELEPPVHRQIAKALGHDEPTLFEQPMLAPALSVALQLARRVDVPALRKRVRQDLAASGNPNGYTVEQYIALCIASCVAVGLATATLEVLMGAGLLIMATPVMAVLGFVVPIWSLHGQAVKRTARIAKQLPYTLDLISLVMQAGATFREAIDTLVRDHPEDDLNQELNVAMQEIDFGTTRSAALANLAERIPLDSLRSVVGAVNQAESLGAPLATTLKLQADMLRQQRSVRAEKLSASASLRILVPSMLILMSVVLIVFAPMIIRYVRGEWM